MACFWTMLIRAREECDDAPPVSGLALTATAMPDVTTLAPDSAGLDIGIKTFYSHDRIMLYDAVNGSTVLWRYWNETGNFWDEGSSTAGPWGFGYVAERARPNGLGILTDGASYRTVNNNGSMVLKTIASNSGFSGNAGTYNMNWYVNGYDSVVESTDGLSNLFESDDAVVQDMYPESIDAACAVDGGMYLYAFRPSNPAAGVRKLSTAGTWATFTPTGLPNADSSNLPAVSVGGAGVVTYRGGAGEVLSIHYSADGVSFGSLTGFEDLIGVTILDSVGFDGLVAVDSIGAVVVGVRYTASAEHLFRGILVGDATQDLMDIASWSYVALETPLPPFEGLHWAPYGAYRLWRDGTTATTVHGYRFVLDRPTAPPMPVSVGGENAGGGAGGGFVLWTEPPNSAISWCPAEPNPLPTASAIQLVAIGAARGGGSFPPLCGSAVPQTAFDIVFPSPQSLTFISDGLNSRWHWPNPTAVISGDCFIHIRVDGVDYFGIATVGLPS